MEYEVALQTLTDLIRVVFDLDTLSVTPELTAPDVPGWDSLGNVRLFIAIEGALGLHFSAPEIADLKNVGELAQLISTKSRRSRGSQPSSRPTYRNE